MKNKKILWIASYPKSGNTWMRSIITSFLFSPDGNFNFGLLRFIEQFEIEERYQFIKKLKSDDYKNLKKINVISKYWIEAQKRLIKNDKHNLLYNIFKTHNVNANYNGFDYTNTENTCGLIYMIRDPRDVAISYSKHLEISIDKTIDFMTKPDAMTRTYSSFPSLLSRWDYNYYSWKNINVPKLYIKYEDLLINPESTLNNIVIFLEKIFKLKKNDLEKKIDKILKSTSFSQLKKMEDDKGFFESENSSNFFRKGQSKQWEKDLSKKQINRIQKEFNKTMKEINYL